MPNLLLMSWGDFDREAHERFQLELGNGKGAASCPLSLAHILKMDLPSRPFLMANLFRIGELIILAGARKTSKSYFLYDILIALASNGKISDKIHSNRSHKVALIDAELPLDQIKDRASQVGTLHGCIDDWPKSITVVSTKHEKRLLDLSDEADQQWLEERIWDAKIVAFDNYGKLTKAGGDGVLTWRRVAAWFDRLQERGITVILVHHENKNEQVRGTMKMVDDADLLISLKRPEKWRPANGNIVEVHFPAARHLHGNQVRPFEITYAEDDTGFHRTVRGLDQGQASSPEDTAPVVAMTETKTHGLSPLQVEILTIARKRGNVRAGDVVKKGVSGYSRTSVTNAFNDLCSKNLLVAQGASKKGRHYTPSGE